MWRKQRWKIILWRKQRWEILLGDIRGQQGPEANNLSLESGNTHSSPIEDGQLQRRGNCRHLFGVVMVMIMEMLAMIILMEVTSTMIVAGTVISNKV